MGREGVHAWVLSKRIVEATNSGHRRGTDLVTQHRDGQSPFNGPSKYAEQKLSTEAMGAPHNGNSMVDSQLWSKSLILG